MMELNEYEIYFLERLRNAGVDDFSLSRGSNGKLVLTKNAPCRENETLHVYVGSDDVMLSCKLSHSHITASDATAELSNLYDLAAKAVHDLLTDKIAISVETSPNGEVVSTGWCLKHAIGQVTPGYAELMSGLFGGPTQTIYWFWSGQCVAL